MSPELWTAIAATVAIFALYYAGQSADAVSDSATAANEQASRTCCKRNLTELQLNRCCGPTPAVTRAGQRVRRCPHVLLLILAAGEPKELSRQSDELEQSCLAARAGDAGTGRQRRLGERCAGTLTPNLSWQASVVLDASGFVWRYLLVAQLEAIGVCSDVEGHDGRKALESSEEPEEEKEQGGFLVAVLGVAGAGGGAIERDCPECASDVDATVAGETHDLLDGSLPMQVGPATPGGEHPADDVERNLRWVFAAGVGYRHAGSAKPSDALDLAPGVAHQRLVHLLLNFECGVDAFGGGTNRSPESAKSSDPWFQPS
jgi:hypothetical protein